MTSEFPCSLSGNGNEFSCKICEKEANGTHFGVLTCRACAAFFRRTVFLNLKYQCRKKDHDAPLNSCRYCRYQKCLSKGMNSHNVQWNRDIASSTLKKCTKSKGLTVSDIKETPGWRKKEAVPPPVFDLTNVFRKIRRTFSKLDLPSDPAFKSRNALEKMEYAFVNNRRMRRPTKEEIEIVESYKLEKLVNTWSNLMTSVAMSCEVLGERVIEEKILLASPTEAFRVDAVRIDFSQITDRPSEDIVMMISPILNQLFGDVVRPILALQPCPTESTFLLCYITCKIGGKHCGGNIPKAVDSFLDRVSNDLHGFYAKTLKTNNYAARMIKFVAVVNALEKVYTERKKIMDLARLFDVFKARISEPCFFE